MDEIDISVLQIKNYFNLLNIQDKLKWFIYFCF